MRPDSPQCVQCDANSDRQDEYWSRNLLTIHGRKVNKMPTHALPTGVSSLRSTLTSLAGVVALIATTAIIAPPSQAEPGAAVAHISYVAEKGQYRALCSFTGWGPGTKDYTCDLKSVDGFSYGSEAKSFTGSWKESKTWFIKRTNTVMCVDAWASGPGGSDSDRECN